MLNRSKLMLALFGATALLALVIGDASARNFSFTEKNFELIWNNAFTGKTKLTFADAAGHSLECNVTLLGHYAASTIAKRTEVTQGTVNHGEAGGCVNGALTIKAETTPWNLRYANFTGTLPIIETIKTKVISAQVRLVEAGGLSCTFAFELSHPLPLIREGSGLEDIKAEEATTVPFGGEFFCSWASPGRYHGRGLILNLPRTATITVTLI